MIICICYITYNVHHMKPKYSEILSIIKSERRTRPALDTVLRSPQTRMEECIAECWKDILDFERIGVDDNFFLLGGDSIQMTQIISQIHNVLNVDISFEDFFSNPTIAGLAAVLDQRIA